MIPVENIQSGQCFKKKQGTFAYIRISDSSAKFFGLKYETHVYGVCYNGNMAEIERGKLVVSVDVSAMNENRKAEEDWNRTFAKAP